MPESESLHKEEVREIVKETVKETLVSIGVDVDNPIEFQADARFVRKLRQTHEGIGVKVIATVVGLVITGGVSMVILGAVAYIRKEGG